MFHPTYSEILSGRQNNKPLLKAKKNAHNLETGFWTCVSPMKRLALLAKAGLNLKENWQNVNMPFTCQALPCLKHSSPVKQQRMQGGSAAKDILNFELFCGLSWGTSIFSISNLKGPVSDTSLSQGTLVWDSYQSPLQNQPLLKASSQGFGRCYFLSFNPECLWCVCNMLWNKVFL